jgi:hypothetical protein
MTARGHHNSPHGIEPALRAGLSPLGQPGGQTTASASILICGSPVLGRPLASGPRSEIGGRDQAGVEEFSAGHEVSFLIHRCRNRPRAVPT